LENDLKQLNRRKNNEIFEYTGRYILNTLQFYENVLNENNISFLLVDKISYTYSIEKDVTLLTIDRITPNDDLKVFQLSFIIFNFKNDSKMESGIIQADVTNINDQSESIIRYIDIKGKIKELEKKSIYKPIPFIENSIITVRYNPQEATVEYWYNNQQLNFVNKIYNKGAYTLKFFVKFTNCSIRFLTFVHAEKSGYLKKNIFLEDYLLEN
jgi:hypothetical protein